MIRILLVDDDPVTRKRYDHTLLKIKDVETEHAENGKEAVEKARANKPDIVIMDYLMPVMNGMEASKLLIQMFPDIVLIVSTTMRKEKLTEDMLSAGAVLLIHKPVNPNMLRLTIENFSDIISQKRYAAERKREIEESRDEVALPPVILKPEEPIYEKKEIVGPGGRKLTRIESKLLEKSTLSGIGTDKFFQNYGSDFSDEVDTIIDLSEEISGYILTVSNNHRLEDINTLGAKMHELSVVLNSFREFPAVVYSLNTFASMLERFDKSCMSAYNLSQLVEILTQFDDVLQEWCNIIFINRDTDNINFIDNLILTYSLQLDVIDC
ncbi:response regulator [Limisalsivibrio acetivorans]|uniref:response regulator n=1 Tax=Limisalsivibrio acetivorans TaxID=1304888 RepID=UPI0003B38967|nr:response regulator [Limisalsivibrio acetivorans]